MADALALRGEEGRDRLRKASGNRLIGIDPVMSEWGNPPFRGYLYESREANLLN